MVYCSMTMETSPAGEVVPFDTQLKVRILMLYRIISPSLKSAFNLDSDNWITQHQAESSKSRALGAINELCSENGITKDEVNNFRIV